MAHIILESAETVNRKVKNFHSGTETQRSAGGVLRHGASTDDHHFCGRHTRDSAKHQTLAATAFAQVFGCDYHGGIPGYFSHGPYHRINSFFILNIIPGDGRNFFVHEFPKRITRLHAYLQSGKQSLLVAHKGNFVVARRCDFENKVTLKNIFPVVGYLGARFTVEPVFEIGVFAGVGFHHHFMAMAYDHGHGIRHQSDPVFLIGCFFGDSNLQSFAPLTHFQHFFLRLHGNLPCECL